MKIILCLLMTFSITCSIHAEELENKLYLKNGSIVNCKVIEYEPSKQIKIRISDGSLLVYQVDQIEKIVTDSSVIKQFDTKYQNFKNGYLEFGGYFFTPGDLNIGLGWWNNNFGARISCGNLDEKYGVQLDLGWVFYDNIQTRQSLNIAVSGFENKFENRNFVGAGPVYNLNTYGFHLEAGILVGNTNYHSPWRYWLQVGYMYCFR